MADDSDDRTETASARHLEQAREEGNIPVSREVPLLAGLAGGAAAVAVQLAAARQSPLIWLSAMLRRSTLDGEADLPNAMAGFLRAALPSAIAATVAILAVGMLQTGFLFRLAALQPDFGRISPLHGIKRLFSLETLIQAGKSLIKLSVLSLGVWLVLRGLLPILGTVPRWSVDGLRAQLSAQTWHLFLLLCGAQAVIAMADFALVRLQHARRLRMSKQEVRDEHKQAEGNPQIKQRLRQLARTRAKRRMMASIKRAAVVVTNPDHYAVALAYERGSRAAPKVVAKGVDEVAFRIRDEARLHHIPVVANPPLARALCRLEIDAEIPMEHFKAVAEIVAYVWRLRGRPVR
jgi:flagellar biosynthetic protein FlhB